MNGPSKRWALFYAENLCYGYTYGGFFPKWQSTNVYYRLSKVECFADGSDWVEVDYAGYAPVDRSSLISDGFETATLASPYLGRVAYYAVTDIEFPPAQAAWPAIEQIGRWGHSTDTSDPWTYLAWGAWFTPVALEEYDRLVFFAGNNPSVTSGMRHMFGTDALV